MREYIVSSTRDRKKSENYVLFFLNLLFYTLFWSKRVILRLRNVLSKTKVDLKIKKNLHEPLWYILQKKYNRQ